MYIPYKANMMNPTWKSTPCLLQNPDLQMHHILLLNNLEICLQCIIS